MEIEEGLLTETQAAARANVTRQTITRATNEGRLPYQLIFNRKVIRCEDLEIYIETMGQRNGHKAKIGEATAKRSRKKPA